MVSGKIDQTAVPEGLRESSLDPSLRDAQGQFHPWMMGGKYLPNLLQNEVELCRVVLKSTTMDVTSLRVRKQKYRFAYRIVDEYSNKFVLKQKTSTRPLSMGKVIRVLDTCQMIFYETGEEWDYTGLVKPQIEYMKEYDYDKEESVDFVTVESTFYPELEDYYEKQKDIWFEELP